MRAFGSGKSKANPKRTKWGAMPRLFYNGDCAWHSRWELSEGALRHAGTGTLSYQLH